MKDRPIRYYVVNSSLFDPRPGAYCIAGFRARIRNLIAFPREAFPFGCSNLPRVLTFALARGVSPDDIANKLSTIPALQGRKPIVRRVDW